MIEQLPKWAGEYIGLPFKDGGRDRKGVDCYGLLRLVLSEQFKISLPSYSEVYDSIDKDRDRIVYTIKTELLADEWKKVETPRAGTGVLFRLGKHLHCAIMLSQKMILHVIEGPTGSYIESRDTPEWKNRIVGFYDHRDL